MYTLGIYDTRVRLILVLVTIYYTFGLHYRYIRINERTAGPFYTTTVYWRLKEVRQGEKKTRVHPNTEEDRKHEGDGGE